MARQTGLIKIKGTLDNVTFYKSKDGHLAKMKTSIDGARIANDPTFARTRENGSEFGSSATSGKVLRDTLRNITNNSADNRVVARVTQIMTQMKNMDLTSARGERNVGVGLQTPEAKALLKGFEFNVNALMGSVLYKPSSLDLLSGVITIADLLPANDIQWPKGSTHATLSGGFAVIDFETGIGELQLTDVANFAIDGPLLTVELTPATPAGTGVNIYLLKVEFFQLVNGVQYSMKNGSYNALKIIEVA